MDKFGNQTAKHGCDRCFCGCKYWENDVCIDCGTNIMQVKNSWPVFQGEILGRTPNGLTANDVTASVISMVAEHVMLVRYSQSRPVSGMVAVQLHFRAPDLATAQYAMRYAGSGVTGFSADTTLRER